MKSSGDKRSRAGDEALERGRLGLLEECFLDGLRGRIVERHDEVVGACRVATRDDLGRAAAGPRRRSWSLGSLVCGKRIFARLARALLLAAET